MRREDSDRNGRSEWIGHPKWKFRRDEEGEFTYIGVRGYSVTKYTMTNPEVRPEVKNLL